MASDNTVATRILSHDSMLLTQPYFQAPALTYVAAGTPIQALRYVDGFFAIQYDQQQGFLPAALCLLRARLVQHRLELLLDVVDLRFERRFLAGDRADKLIDQAARLLDPEVGRLEPPLRDGELRALDRVLMSGNFVVPLFYAPEQWLARWTTIERPETTSMHGTIPETWWRKPKAQ